MFFFHHFPHTAAKARASDFLRGYMFFFTICRTRLQRLDRQINFLGIGYFFTNFLHGAADAP